MVLLLRLAKGFKPAGVFNRLIRPVKGFKLAGFFRFYYNIVTEVSK